MERLDYPNYNMEPLYDEDELIFSPFESYSAYQTFNSQSLTLDTGGNIGINSLESKNLMTNREYESSCNSKQMAINSNASTSTSTNTIDFGYPNPPPVEQQQFYGTLERPNKSKDAHLMPQEIFSFPGETTSQANSYNQLYDHHASEFCEEIKMNDGTINRSAPSQVQEHVMAERLRREKLNKLFIRLSSHIPGLKKLDKASILKDAFEYIKTLQERERVLQEEANKQLEEPLVTNKRMKMVSDDDDSTLGVIDIKTRVRDQNVLIRAHCKKPKGIILKLLGELEELHLTIIDCSVIPFEKNLDITITAQIDAKFCITRNELMEEVRSVFLKLM